MCVCSGRFRVVIQFLLAAALSAVGQEPKSQPVMYVDVSRSIQLNQPVWHHLPGWQRCSSLDLIRAQNLNKADLLVIRNIADSIPYTEAEIQAVKTFVRTGGGLLLIGNLSDSPGPFAPFQDGTWQKVEMLPTSRFASNQLAKHFGVSLTNTRHRGKPEFNAKAPLNLGIDLTPLCFPQALSALRLREKARGELVHAWGEPVAVARQHGEGRVIVCGASWLFWRRGDPKEFAAQQALLEKWCRWLIAGREARPTSLPALPHRIDPPLSLETKHAVFLHIPQLADETKRIAREWKDVWAVLQTTTGLPSAMALAPPQEGDGRMRVHVRAALRGGYASEACIGMAAMGRKSDRISLLGHEVGHKLLGGPTHGVSEAFAEWLSCLCLRSCGCEKVAAETERKYATAFRAVDPDGTALDVADPKASTEHFHACMGKWSWIIGYLETRYGTDFLKHYVAAMNKRFSMDGSHHRLRDGQRIQITMADMVLAMSDAAGRDLSPWFRSIGTSLNMPAGK
jgi:hypothetical protein